MTQPPPTHPYSQLMTFFGGTMDVWEEGRIVMSIKLEDRHMNPGGRLHGGVLAALIDEATGRAIISVRGYEAMAAAPHATIDMNVSFLSSAVPGDAIVCEAKTLRVGRSFAFAEAEVRRTRDDTLVAKGRATYAIPTPRRA